jgi:hypothetical protein
MTTSRSKLPYWRRIIPAAQFDIAALRPRTLPRGTRFETPSDVYDESRRSQALVESRHRGTTHAAYLEECREGHYRCEQTYCPRCARAFRRHFVGELLRLHSEFVGKMRILVILLEAAPRGRLQDLKIDRYRHLLRKRLDRAGLGRVPVIGGFEVIYRARSKQWVLHVNLVMFGGDAKAIAGFEDGFRDHELYRAIERVMVKDPAEQLSYVLKFTTYHRPREQHGSKKSEAVPLNPPEHFELLRWMAQHEFSDHLFLFNARRHGASLLLSSKAARNAWTQR